jgi:hypothetical protein
MRDEPDRAAVGMPWYRAADYERMVALVDDPHSFAPSYGSWLAAAESNMREAERVGVRVARVEIDPDAFVRWCEVRGLARDGAARAEFVKDRLRQDRRGP